MLKSNKKNNGKLINILDIKSTKYLTYNWKWFTHMRREDMNYM